MIGPLLFVIHINDIETDIDNHSEINLFVNDAKIFSKSNDALEISLDKISGFKYLCVTYK